MAATRHRLVGAALALGLALATPPALAQEVPRGQFGMVLVFRRNLAELAERFGLGYFWGFTAAFHVSRPEEPLSAALSLTTLFGRSQFFGVLGDDDDTVAEGPLKYVELSLGPRIRYEVSAAVPLYLVASGGIALLRTNVPVPPDDDRLHLGGYAGLGFETYLGGLLVALDVRYGLLGEQPRGVSFMLGAAVGR